MAELTNMEQHFPSSRRELGRVEERMRALDTAMQKAKQVGQHPSLESYCDLEQVHTYTHTHTKRHLLVALQGIRGVFVC